MDYKYNYGCNNPALRHVTKEAGNTAKFLNSKVLFNKDWVTVSRLQTVCSLASEFRNAGFSLDPDTPPRWLIMGKSAPGRQGEKQPHMHALKTLEITHIRIHAHA